MPALVPLRDQRLQDLLDGLPLRPGVYLMKGLDGTPIYIGKAKNLRSRVRSYFRASGDDRAFISRLETELGDIEVVVTPTEKDALILERKLIQMHGPCYNVSLTDDKNFLSIRIGTGHPYPRLLMQRRRPRVDPAADAPGRWFGPYTSSASARQTFRLIQSTMGLRTCTDAVFSSRSRPCLLHQMGRCLGMCAQSLATTVYAQRVEQAVQFLGGRWEEMVDELSEKMKAASAALQFEEAARLRDKIRAVRDTLQGQPLVDAAQKDRDVVGLHREGAAGVVVILRIRRGSLLGANRIPFAGLETPLSDLTRQLLAQHYGSGADLPAEILLGAETLAGAEDPEDLSALGEWAADLRRGPVRVWVPRRGPALRLAQMARENAAEAFRARLATASLAEDRLRRLEQTLRLSRFPQRIECFDLSTLGGQWSVGSMAVLIKGAPAKSNYRRFRIQQAAPDSDVDMMREVLQRRFRRIIEQSESGPDLVVLDGGRGQLRVIETLFADLGVTDVDLVALAKGRSEQKAGTKVWDKVFVPGRKNPIRLRPESDELFLLARVRDEAHRFAVGYHRKLRSRTHLRSVLDEIPGVGPVLRRRLLTHFGSLKGVREAAPAQLALLPGVNQALAVRIFEFLAELGETNGSVSNGS